MIYTGMDNAALIKAAQSILTDDIKHLQIMPEAALKLLKLVNDDNVSIEKLSTVIATEPVLTAKILKQINSAAYALPGKTTSIKHAVTMLGLSTVRQLAITQLFYDKLIQRDTTKSFNLLLFWKHCLYVASLSKRIASALNYPAPDLIYTGGLLHDIGKLVLENYGRLTYSDFIDAINNNKTFSIEAEERRFFGITHTEIGHIFCLEWRLPPSMTAIISYHHTPPDRASPYANFKMESAIVSLANYIAWIQGIGSVTYVSHPSQSDLFELIDIDALNLDALLQQVDQDMRSTEEFYDIKLQDLTTLRASVVKATINLRQMNTDKPCATIPPTPNKISSSCLTTPHHSLDPHEFIPQTLEAIHDEFFFDHSILFTINPKHRCLMASYWWPQSTLPTQQPLMIGINNISGSLLTCLREKIAVIINATAEPDSPLIQQLNTTEFIAAPVLHDNHLTSLLYADYSLSKHPIQEQLRLDIMPIAAELGFAMFNAKQYRQEKKRAQIDHLTQLFNKQMIHEVLTELFQKDKSEQAHIAIGFVDIDKFKLFNDTCGHQMGDQALKIVADILRSLTRPGDFIGRYGGEEFLFVLKNTDQAGAYRYAERIRLETERRGKIMSQRFQGLQLTISIGVSMYSRHYSHYTDMIEVADQAMYQAKKAGRNKVVILPNLALANS